MIFFSIRFVEEYKIRAKKIPNNEIGMPQAAAVPILFLIDSPWNLKYGVVIVPPPIPNIELIVPVKKENILTNISFFLIVDEFPWLNMRKKEIIIRSNP